MSRCTNATTCTNSRIVTWVLSYLKYRTPIVFLILWYCGTPFNSADNGKQWHKWCSPYRNIGKCVRGRVIISHGCSCVRNGTVCSTEPHFKTPSRLNNTWIQIQTSRLTQWQHMRNGFQPNSDRRRTFTFLNNNLQIPQPLLVCFFLFAIYSHVTAPHVKQIWLI